MSKTTKNSNDNIFVIFKNDLFNYNKELCSMTSGIQMK